MRTYPLFGVLACLVLSGCANLFAVNYTRDLTKQSAVMDSDQRVIIRGGSSGKSIICAEPSPDTMSVISISGSGRLSPGERAAYEAALSASETGATIGLRTPSTQLMRDGMYRLCEAYMNDTLSPIGFADNMRQYQRMMIALLAVEQLTGSVRAPAVTIRGGSATSSQSGVSLAAVERVEAQTLDLRNQAVILDQQIAGKKAELEAIKDKPDQAEKAKGLQAEIDALGTRKKALEETIKSKETTLAELRKALANSLQAASVGGGSADIEPIKADTRPDAASVAAVSGAVERIVTGAMNRDRFVGVCFDFMMREDARAQPAAHAKSATEYIQQASQDLRNAALDRTYLSCSKIVMKEAGLSEEEAARFQLR
jgi:hypothetical protein